MRTMALLCVLALVCLVPQLSAALEEGSTTKDVRVAVVIFGCSRPSHLRKTFRSLSKQDPSVLRHVQFFVSIDAHRRSRQYVPLPPSVHYFRTVC